MGLFGSKKISYVGVDFGVGGLKLVELQNEKGRARLVTYAFTERQPGTEPLNPIDDAKGASELLKNAMRTARCTVTKCIASLPVASVFSSVITVPNGTDKEIQEAIQMQARKLIPVPLEEMVLDFKPIRNPEVKPIVPAPKPDPKAPPAPKEEKPKTLKVLITGASKALVQKYVNVAKMAGVELVSLETETFALIRSLVGKDRTPTMLVDIGASRTNIIVVENGIPFITRSLDMGGANFTKAMAEAMSLGLGEAEKMKCDIKGVSGIYPGEGMPKIFESTVAPLVTELRYSLSLFSSRSEGETTRPVERIILTGGSALLPQLSDHFARELVVKVYVGDPWARVIYSDGLRPVLDEIGCRFAVSVGLAMRDIE